MPRRWPTSNWRNSLRLLAAFVRAFDILLLRRVVPGIRAVEPVLRHQLIEVPAKILVALAEDQDVIDPVGSLVTDLEALQVIEHRDVEAAKLRKVAAENVVIDACLGDRPGRDYL